VLAIGSTGLRKGILRNIILLNMKATLTHSLLAWYPLYEQVEMILGKHQLIFMLTPLPKFVIASFGLSYVWK